MEHFIVVVHAVAISIGHTRICGDVARHTARRNHRRLFAILRHNVYRPHVNRVGKNHARFRAIPRLDGSGEVAEHTPAFICPRLHEPIYICASQHIRRNGTPCRSDIALECANICHIESHIAIERLLESTLITRKEAAHERSRDIVIAEVANGLD